MPTICDIKMELKELGVKGLTGKKKDELLFMLYNAKNPVPKVIPQKRQKAPAPVKAPAPAPKPSKGERFSALANIHGFQPVGQYLDDENLADERRVVSAISPEMTKKVRELPPLEPEKKPLLYGLEFYLNTPNENYDRAEEDGTKYNTYQLGEKIREYKQRLNKYPNQYANASLIPKLISVLDNIMEKYKGQKYTPSKVMIESLKPFGFVYTYDPLRQLKTVVAEAIEASKEGGSFKRRENWKGKAGFMKKIDKLWNEWTGSPDAFFREVPYHFNWKPKDAEEGDSHAHKMYMKHGINID